MPKRSTQQGSQPIYPTSQLQKRRHVDRQDPQPHAASAIPNPITIPEILILIGEYLDSRTILLCLRVCKKWYRLLLPIVWFEVKMNRSGPTHGPFILDIHKNSLLIRKLAFTAPTTNSAFLGDQQLHFCNLRELVLYPMSSKSSYVDEALLVNFIKAHRATLQKINCWHVASQALLDALEECTRLQQLTAKFPTRTQDLQDQWKSRFDKLWSRTKVLTLEGFGSLHSTDGQLTDTKVLDKMLAQVGTTDIQQLDLCIQMSQRSIPLERLVLIIKSPRLKSLKWTVSGPDTMALLALICQSHQFGQQLNSLSLTRVDFGLSSGSSVTAFVD